ncbi:MAG: hypothetical protein SV186_05765 [Candidatus Nanohaloarchaea archaeon]|nr:hypothetical protein [Candidatus Nanohaloarchaea archaeon]
MRFSFPDGISPPSVEERERFYDEEFDLQSVQDLYYRWKKPVFALDIGTETTLYKGRFKKYKGKLVYVKEYDDLEELQEKFVTYAPEDLYYDTRTYENDPRQSNTVWERPTGKQLVFDLDPELVECPRCENRRRHMDDEERASYTFCEECFSEVAEKTAQLVVLLDRHFDAVKAYFSGRGFHIHVKDPEGFDMDDIERDKLASKMAKRFPIDKKITAGEKTLIRLPGSLHGLTGRKVVEVSLDDLQEPLDILYEKSVPEVFEE